MTPSWADQAKRVLYAIQECDAPEQLEYRLGDELYATVDRIGLDRLIEMPRLEFCPGGKVQDLLKRHSTKTEIEDEKEN